MDDSRLHEPPHPPEPGTWLVRRLGLGGAAGSDRLFTAFAVDSLGSGLLLTLQIVYFAAVTDLGLARIGAAVSLAQVLALPGPLLAGQVNDRLGPVRTVALGNVVAGLGYLGFLVADGFWPIVAVVLVQQLGVAMYWTGNAPLVALVADDGSRVRWFAGVNAVRNAGLGVGGALGAAALAGWGTTGLTVLVAVNAATSMLAGVLVATWRAPHRTPTADAPDAPGPATGRGGYRQALTDPHLVSLLVVNTGFVFGAMSLSLLLAPFLQVVGGPTWVAGALLSLNTVVLVLLLGPAARVLERLRPAVPLALGGVLAAVGFAVGAAAGVPGAPVVVVTTVSVLVFTVAEALTSPVVGAVTVGIAPAALRGRYQAAVQTTWSVVGAVAPALFTSLLTTDPRLPWLALVGISLVGAAAAAGLRTVRAERV